MFAALVGLLLGIGSSAALLRSGIASDRRALGAAIAVLLCAIAAFYPVFAVEHGGLLGLLIHLLIAAGFCACAYRGAHSVAQDGPKAAPGGALVGGFQTGLSLLALGLMAHGVFDAALMFGPAMASGAPHWWPPFCAAYDITLGLFALWQSRRLTT